MSEEERVSGRVTYWSHVRGFGFIQLDGHGDVFVHVRQIQRRPDQVGRKIDLEVGEVVRFTVGPGKNGKTQALDVERV